MIGILSLLLFYCTEILLAACGLVPSANRRNRQQAEIIELESTPPPFEVTRDDILGLRGGRAIPNTDWISNIPCEVWVEIFKRVSTNPVEFFKSLRICKTFFAILHNNCDFILTDAITDETELADALRASDIQFSYRMLYIFRRRIMDMSAALGKLREKHDNPVNSFKMDIYCNTHDLQLISDIFALPVKTKMSLPTVMSNLGLTNLGVYCPERCPMHYYVPSEGDQKLFEKIIPEVVVITTSQTMAYHYSSMFVPSLISEYIIPSYFDKNILSDQDLMAVRAAIRNTDDLFYEYFQHLLWACYYLTGDIRKTEHTTISKIASHLEHLGFTWNMLFSKYSPRNFLSIFEKTVNMDSIFKVARHWGLDIYRIAWKTQSWSKRSAAIMTGDIPNYLTQPERNPVVEVIQVLHPYNMKLCKQTLTENGYSQLQPEAARKFFFRDTGGLSPVLDNIEEMQTLHSENMNESFGPAYEPPAKRQRTQYDHQNYHTTLNHLQYRPPNFLQRNGAGFGSANRFPPSTTSINRAFTTSYQLQSHSNSFEASQILPPDVRHDLKTDLEMKVSFGVPAAAPWTNLNELFTFDEWSLDEEKLVFEGL